MAQSINWHEWSVNISLLIQKERERWQMCCKDYQGMNINFFLTINKKANMNPFMQPVLSFSKHLLSTFCDLGVQLI